jgi:GLPGLI family protein
MKNIFLTVCVIFISVFSLSAQKKSQFEGLIKYAVSFEDSNLPPEAAAMFKGAEMNVYIKNLKERIDVDMVLQSTTSIIDNKNKTLITLMDVMGQKYLIKMGEEDIKKEQESAPEPDIKYSEETKEIAGYKCKKAVVTVNNGAGIVSANVFYTEEIPVSDIKSVYKGLKGFPLEYAVNMGGIQMNFAAKTVSKETIPDEKFEAPKEGYTEITAEALQGELMKQMGGK